MPHRPTRPSRLPTCPGGRLAIAGLVAAVLGACTAPPPPDAAVAGEADVAAALDSVYARFSEAYARANVQLLMDEVYAPDAHYLPPGSPILEGQDQFRGQFYFLERFARAGEPGPDITFEIVHRDIAGELAYDVGVYTIRTPDAPEPDGGQGKFVVVWKRNGRGEWRIVADAFSALD